MPMVIFIHDISMMLRDKSRRLPGRPISRLVLRWGAQETRVELAGRGTCMWEAFGSAPETLQDSISKLKGISLFV